MHVKWQRTKAKNEGKQTKRILPMYFNAIIACYCVLSEHQQHINSCARISGIRLAMILVRYC